MVPFCSLAPLPSTASPGRPCGVASMTAPPYGSGMVLGGWFIACATSIIERPLRAAPFSAMRLLIASRRTLGMTRALMRGALLREEIAHRIEAHARHAERLHARHQRQLHELAQLRLVLEQIGLRAGYAHQFLEQGPRALARNMRRQAFPDEIFRPGLVKE